MPYTEVYVGDFGFTQKDSYCKKGTEGYMAPELKPGFLGKEDTPKWTSFKTTINRQSDAFALGLVLFSNEVSQNDAAKIQILYADLFKDNDQNTILENTDFPKKVREYLKLKKIGLYQADSNKKSIQYWQESIYELAIIRLLDLNYLTRWPVSLALFVVSKAYGIEKETDSDFIILKAIYKDNDKGVEERDATLKRFFGIITEEKPTEILNAFKSESKNWEKDFIFEFQIKRTEEILDLRSLARRKEAEPKVNKKEEKSSQKGSRPKSDKTEWLLV